MISNLQQRLAWLLKLGLPLFAFLAALLLLAFNPSLAMVAAGIALFLMGMMQLDAGLKVLSGGFLERALHLSTNRAWKSLLFGALSTALVQSSTLVTLVAISFVSAGFIGLTAGILVLFGANLGTTSGAWLIATLGLKVDMASLSMPFLALGFVLSRLRKQHQQASGQMLLGVALIFLGIHYLKLGFDGLDDGLNLAELYSPGLFGVLLFVFLGVVLTVIMQSSHASLLITLTALASGQIGYEAALALAIGANVGTTVTAIIGALGSNSAGRQLAASHVIFNVVTALVALLLLQPLMSLVEWVAQGLGWHEQQYTLRLALFHTLFNLIGIAVMLPWVPRLSSLLSNYFQPPERPPLDSEQAEPKAEFLLPSALATADTSLQALEQQYQSLLTQALEAMAQGLMLNLDQRHDAQSLQAWLAQPLVADDYQSLAQLYSHRLKPVQAQMLEFAWQSPEGFNEAQDARLQELLSASRTLVEAVKNAKHLQKNLWRLNDHVNTEIAQFYRDLRWLLNRSLLQVLAYQQQPEELSQTLTQLDHLYQQEARVFMARWQQALRNKTIDSLNASSLLNDLNYCHDLIYSLHESLMHLASTSSIASAEPLVAS